MGAPGMIICITFLCCVKWLTSLPVSGSSSAVERQLPKLDVAGSIPVSRSMNPAKIEYPINEDALEPFEPRQ